MSKLGPAAASRSTAAIAAAPIVTAAAPIVEIPCPVEEALAQPCASAADKGGCLAASVRAGEMATLMMGALLGSEA